MQAASLIKLYIMGAVYENYDQITGQYGRDSVDSNLYSMITVSDNDAANTLTTYLGGGDSAAGMQLSTVSARHMDMTRLTWDVCSLPAMRMMITTHL